jgi:UDP-N-acetylglucosamine 4,6-dehydratase/5-epimerase
LNNKNILITGGTGSFGKAMVDFIIKNYKPKKILIYSRDEQKHFEMQKKYPEKKFNMRYLIGDIRDKERLLFATKEVNIVIHAAAMKHVSLGEYNPFEVVKTNILGSQNVIDACIANKVHKVIALSTDKASSPINLYGASKLTSDKLFTNANNYLGKSKTIFSVVRYGNVMGSKGSIIPIFINQFKNNQRLRITDKKMTRFNITLGQSVEFVDSVYRKMFGGEVFVPKLKSYKILDLAAAISDDSPVVFTGVRPGEKIDEEMISEDESLNTLEFKDFYIIMPSSSYSEKNKFFFMKRYQKFKEIKKAFSYRSNNNKFLSVKEIKKLIERNSHTFVF